MKHTYEVEPRPEILGGGWRVRLLEDSEEVGGGVFDCFDDAQELAEDWISTRTPEKY